MRETCSKTESQRLLPLISPPQPCNTGREAMDCKTVAHNLCAFLDGQLNPAEARALNGHLRACWMCRAVAELARRTLAQIG